MQGDGESHCGFAVQQSLSMQGEAAQGFVGNGFVTWVFLGHEKSRVHLGTLSTQQSLCWQVPLVQADGEEDLCVLPSHVKLSQVGHLGQDFVRLVPNPSSGQLSPAGHFLVWVIDPAALQGGHFGDQGVHFPGSTPAGQPTTFTCNLMAFSYEVKSEQQLPEGGASVRGWTVI